MIYFIQSGGPEGPIKIGFTAFDDGLSRLKTLQIGNPYELVLVAMIEGSASFERTLHKRFASYHLRGEWFAHHDDLAAFIAENGVKATPPATRLRGYDRRIKTMPPATVVRSLIDMRDGRMYWRERPREMFDIAATHVSWNRRYAGQEVGGKTVTIFGTVYAVDDVRAVVNKAA